MGNPTRFQTSSASNSAHRTQSRRPAGSPNSVGGRFAPEIRGESALELGGTAGPSRTEHRPGAAIPVGVEDAWVEEVCAAARTAAVFADRRSGTSRLLADRDAEDIAQEALLQWWYDRGRGHRIDNDAAYTRTAARAIASRVGDRMRAEDRRANQLLHRWEEAFQQAHARQPSPRERDAEAASILARWKDRRHLPSKDFHRFSADGAERHFDWMWPDTDRGEIPVPAAADGTSEASLAGNQAPLVDVIEDRPAMSVEPGSWTAAALSLAAGENGVQKREKVAARRISCAALAESRSAPMPQVGCLSHAAVSAANTRLGRYRGGVPGAIATWRAGETDAGTDALFAPFGPSLDEGARDRICDLLELGDPKTLWNSASWIADEHNAGAVTRIVASTGRQVGRVA